MDPFKRRVLGMVVSHFQTLYKQTDLQVEVVQVGEEGVLIRVREPAALPSMRAGRIRRFSVRISEVDLIESEKG